MSVWPFARRTVSGSVRLLIDIGGASIGGACVWFGAGKPPLVCYAKRVAITSHDAELPEVSLERALKELALTLSTEGAIALKNAGAPSRFDEVTVALDAPWQQTIVHIEEKRGDAPFIFTKRVMGEILRNAERAVTEGSDRKVEQHVVGIRLNGYETADPIGKTARRAALIMLISWMHEATIEAVTRVIHETFHIRRPAFVSGVSLRYRVLREAFPHERDVLILDSVGHAVALSLVRGRSLVAIHEFPGGESEEEWVTAVKKALKVVAGSYPLPRTILLVAEATDAREHATALQAGGLKGLWVADEPPKILPISRLPATTVAFVRDMPTDIRLSLMAQYATLAPLGE